MSSITWITPSGSLGSVVEGSTSVITVSAIPVTTGASVAYSLLNGSLPVGMTLNTHGIISGTVAEVSGLVTHQFTIRVTETGTTPSISDRTFSIVVDGPAAPVWVTTPGTLGTFTDSLWISIPLIATSTDPGVGITFLISDGSSLPTGLWLDASGYIRGYVAPPSIASAVYTFTIIATSSSGSTPATFSITITDQSFIVGFTGRPPAILNVYPLSRTPDISDPYYNYYTRSTILPTVTSDDQFIFKIVGYNFDAQSDTDPYTNDLEYVVTGLSQGSTTADAFSSMVTDGNGTTGWINGTIRDVGSTITDYTFTVQCRRISDPTLVSDPIIFKFRVDGDIDSTITWRTPPDLGIIGNGQSSEISLVANFPNDTGRYRLRSGSLPTGLEIASKGDIIGKVGFKTPFTDYRFVVEAYLPGTVTPSGGEIGIERQFTVRVVEAYTQPYDTHYMRALLVDRDRRRVDRLLEHITTVQSPNIYRQGDSNFGIAHAVIYEHDHGVPAQSIRNPLNSSDTDYFDTSYTNVVSLSHYDRQLTLGPLNTAQARDSDNRIIYEVVYCAIVDDLVNAAGASISYQVPWPHTIPNAENLLFPNSLDNMRQRVVDTIGSVGGDRVLPKWMSSQQPDGNVIGFQPCWVLCYTLPGRSVIVKESISEWLRTNTDTVDPPLRSLNQISFEIDRFTVDRSMTVSWGLDTPITWPTNPTSPVVLDDSADSYIFFPRPTIIRAK